MGAGQLDSDVLTAGAARSQERYGVRPGNDLVRDCHEDGERMDLQAPAERVDDTARHSESLQWAVRGGLVGYGLMHLLVAWVAVRLVMDAHAGAATGQGALAQLADGGLGRATLAAMTLGFAVLALWQLLAALVGYQERDGLSRHLMRVSAAGRVVTYGYLTAACAGLALQGDAGRGRSPQSTTARLMALPAGPWLIAAIGVAAAVIGVALAIFGWQEGFLEQLDEQARTGDRRGPIAVIGRAGYLAKGLAFVVIGVLLVWVAWSHDPSKSGGLDEALRELLGGPLGTVAIIVVGVGIGCFGLYLFARARHLNRRTLTS